MEEKKTKTYCEVLNNTCCVAGGYKGYNLYKANPFDPREIRQPNAWCSNELLLRDKDMRCESRIQMIDISMGESLRLAKADAIAKGIWQR